MKISLGKKESAVVSTLIFLNPNKNLYAHDRTIIFLYKDFVKKVNCHIQFLLSFSNPNMIHALQISDALTYRISADKNYSSKAGQTFNWTVKLSNNSTQNFYDKFLSQIFLFLSITMITLIHFLFVPCNNCGYVNTKIITNKSFTVIADIIKIQYLYNENNSILNITYLVLEPISSIFNSVAQSYLNNPFNNKFIWIAL